MGPKSSIFFLKLWLTFKCLWPLISDSVMSFSELTADHDVGVNGSVLKPNDSYEFVRMEEDEEDWIPLPSKPK